MDEKLDIVTGNIELADLYEAPKYEKNVLKWNKESSKRGEFTHSMIRF